MSCCQTSSTAKLLQALRLIRENAQEADRLWLEETAGDAINDYIAANRPNLAPPTDSLNSAC